MASKTNASGVAAIRYATALVDIASDSKAVDRVEKDLLAFQEMIRESDDLRLVCLSPAFRRQDQEKAVTALAEKAKFHDLTKRFFAVLARNRRLPVVESIIAAACQDIARRRGEVSAHVRSAYALSAAQTKALKEGLSKSVGSQVILNVEVDKTLIGGLVVTVGSRMVDGSVKRKLERLGQVMTSGSNQNITSQQKEVS